MKTFMAAAARSVKEQTEEDGPQEPWLEFGLLGQTFTITDKPTMGQGAAVLGAMASGSAESVRGVLTFLDNVLDDTGGLRIRRMLERGQIEFELLWGGDDQNEEGIVDYIIGEASEGPTQGATDSSPSQPTTGKKSTGRSPGKGSTLSD